jgi:hypothetical protein
MKDVIVSFANKGRDDYNRLLLRLIDSCKEHWKGDLLIYSPDHDLWMYRDVPIHHSWPDPEGIQSFTHKDMPYQFKTALIQKAIELGYERIIWLDSSMQLKKDLTPLFDETGLTFFENLGHPTWKYLSDYAANKIYQHDRYEEHLKKIPQIWGGAFALDITKEGAKLFFEDLKRHSLDGSFLNYGSTREGFIAHRHDQAVMSVLLYLWRKYLMLPYGQILCPPHDTSGEYGTDPYLVCRGL